MRPNQELKISVKPFEMLELVEADVSTLSIVDSLKVVDIRDRLSFDILKEEDYTVITVKMPIREMALTPITEGALVDE